MNASNDSDRANALRWTAGERGRYEVYYATMNHLKSGAGFWIRHTLNAPCEGMGAPYAQVWFSYFNYREPERNFAIKKRYPIGDLRANHDPFHLRIGDCELGGNRIIGGLTGQGHDAFWDLNFIPAATVHRLLPGVFYLGGLADTKVLSPNLHIHFHGQIRVDGVKYDFKGDPGCQTHLWGKKHAHRWVWAHCGAFAEDPSAVFEGIAVQVKRAGVTSPPLSFISLFHRGKAHRLTEIYDPLRIRSRYGSGLWSFFAITGNQLYRGEISCRPQDCVRAEYSDPDGEKAYCHNTETGSSSIRIYKRKNRLSAWRQTDTITSVATTHVEFGSREPDPAVTNVFEEVR